MRNILNVIFDVLILLAIVVAGVGHMLPWFRADYARIQGGAPPIPKVDFGKGDLKDGKIDLQQDLRRQQDAQRDLDMEVMSFQAWHAERSAIALGVLALLVSLSLLVHWEPTGRRILVLSMFVASLAAIFFMTLGLTHYPITEWHRRFAGNLWIQAGFGVALAPTCCCAAFSLIRMIWTMPPLRKKESLVLTEAVAAEPNSAAAPRDASQPPRHSPEAFAPREKL